MNIRVYDLFVGGSTVAPQEGKYISRHSPVDRREVARFAEGTASDVDLAVKAAREAFDNGPWPRMSGMERARVLQRFAQLVRAELERLAILEVEEVGKPIRFARGDIEVVIASAEFAASLAMQMSGLSYTNFGTNRLGVVVREPAGVAALITAWNFPAALWGQKVPYALAAGCTVVVKPSEFTSSSTFELARIAAEAGVPAGVLNVVSGYGDPVGEQLVSHPDVDIVSFTGSTATGRRVLNASAKNFTKTALELGGKSANIVFEDANIDEAVDGAMMGIYFNGGECCIAGSRLFLQASIADKFLEKLVARSRKLKVGDPFDETTDIGTLIHDQHRDKVLNYIAKGQEQGAELILDGNSQELDGCFVRPTVFDKVTPDMAIFREEIFGPVLSVTRFETVDEAISLANNTDYGLAGFVWTSNLETAFQVVHGMRSGMVQVNTIIDGSPQLPHLGVKSSGLGYEQGHAGFEEFTQLKSVLINTGRRAMVFPES